MSILDRRQQNLFDAACEYLDSLPDMAGWRLVAQPLSNGWMRIYLYAPGAKIKKDSLIDNDQHLYGDTSYSYCGPPVFKLGCKYGYEIQAIRKMINSHRIIPPEKLYVEFEAGQWLDDPRRKSC